MVAVAWVAAAIVLGILEVVTLAFFAVFLAVGALAAALAAALGASVLVQAVVFLVLSVLGIVVLRPVLTRRRPSLRSGAAGMLGQTAVVADEITDSHRAGHVQIAGESWRAISADGSAIAAGATVTILEIQGTTLVVEPSKR